MPTSTLTARCNARPTRLAFVLPTPDRATLFAVIARATSLWGGVYNPIIILDGSTRVVHGQQEEHSSAGDYLVSQASILKAFDPDLLFSFSAAPLPEQLSEFQHRTNPAERLDSMSYGNELVSEFVEVWPVLHEFWEREFKFSVKPPANVRYAVKSEAEQSLLLAARFGMYSNDDGYAFLRERFGAVGFTYDSAFKSAMKRGEFLTPIGFTTNHCFQQRQFIHSHAFFLMDPENVFDVIDYWNLRAAGMILISLTLADYKDFEPLVREFGASAAYPINEHMTNHVALIKGRSITEDEVKGVADWIRSLGFLKDFSTMGWVPRFNMNYYGVGNEIDVRPIKAFESSPVGVLTDGYGSIEGPTIPFLPDWPSRGRWSMDMSFYSYGQNDSCYRLPWLNVGCDELVKSKIGMVFDLDASRVSKHGIVTAHKGKSSSTHLTPITATDVTCAFLRGKEIEYVGTSSPGLAMERIVEMFGGVRGCDLFKNSAIRELLEELATGGTKLASEVRASVNRSMANYLYYAQPATKEQKADAVNALLDRATEAKVFRLGLVFQCSRCKRHNWYAVAEFDANYSCKSCFARETTPRLDTTKWHYSSDGFFRSSNKLDGNITILLTLNFYNNLFKRSLQYAPSFDYKLADEPHEMDFAIVASEDLSDEVDMIFGESKSGTALSADERTKLKIFGEKTGSYLCFCTLAEDFSEEDKAFFRDLVDSKVSVILLNRYFLEMEYFDLIKFQNEHHTGRSKTQADWIMRITILRTLGKNFADKHNIWL
jgi:hypothetical protein